MSLLQRILSYLHYYITAGNRHSLQAPFLYQLNDAVFRKDKITTEHQRIEKIRYALLQNSTLLNVEDFGAGSKGKIVTSRTVKEIVHRSSKSPKYARLLWRLVNYLQPAQMLELGTAAGISALYQCNGNPKGHLTTLEGSGEIALLAHETLKGCNATIITGNFEDTLPELLQKGVKYNYVLIDGNHRREAVLRYFNLLIPHLSEESALVIDDINWTSDMQLLWKELSADPRVQVSVDLFQLGLLIMRPGLSKESFTIRY